jgi:hypothetical protein
MSLQHVQTPENAKNWINLVQDRAIKNSSEQNVDELWQLLYKENGSIDDAISKIKRAQESLSLDPIHLWLDWVVESHYLFCLINSDMNLNDLSVRFKIKWDELFIILRNFLFEEYPAQKDNIKAYFSYKDNLNPIRLKNFKNILVDCNLPQKVYSARHHPFFSYYEVHLTKEWPELLSYLATMNPYLVEKKKKKIKIGGKTFFRIIQETSFLLLICGGLVLGIRKLNFWYETDLTDKIKLLEPTFVWLDKKLSYKIFSKENRQISLSDKQIDELESLEKLQLGVEKPGARFDPESDETTLASVENIPLFPKDNPQDYFEQKNKESFRDKPQLGENRKAYRILIKASAAPELKEKIKQILESMDAKKADQYELGTTMPGGYYFNCFFPSKNIKEFFSMINEMAEVTLFESRSSVGSPANHQKVFIWIKTI